MKYRKEVDGLRAVALLPVILFHAGFTTFSGGFVGVDIFFVISGYLITSIIVDQIEKGSFSLLNFYERRARRILPALFFVMLCTLPFAWFWMLPKELKQFSESLIAVPLFASNFLFYLNIDYFDAATELKPLLHTWSLAVEEQYYFLFPIFLMPALKLGKKWVILLLFFVAIISAVAAHWGSTTHPLFTFYLLPTRGFEILIGALISLYISYKKNIILVSKSVSQLVSIVGFLLILCAIFTLSSKTPSPSFYTLLPSIGAGLILLFANNNNLVGKLLGTKLFVGIGLISYSTYLWHQPLFAFFKIINIYQLTNTILIVLCLSSLFLGFLSWKYIEKPFRNQRYFSRRVVFILSIIFSCIFIAVGLVGYKEDGFSKVYVKSLTSDQQKIFSFINMDVDNIWRQGTCSLRHNQTHKEFTNECKDVDKNKETILIWGDSHAASLSKGLRDIQGNVAQLTASACPPLIHQFFIDRPNCELINDYVGRQIKLIKPNKIFLLANWYAYYQSYDVNKLLQDTILFIKEKSPNTEITIIGSIPQFDPSLPELIIQKNIKLNQAQFLTLNSYKKLIEIDEKLLNITSNQNVDFISALEIFCKKDLCQITAKLDDEFEPTTFDYAHLTKTGSVLLANGLLKKR